MNQQRMLLAVVVLMTGAAAHPSAAQNPETPPPRRGGLLPQRTAAPSVEPISRAELLRRFDLNADGSIDEAEAEMARSRMRRERAEVLRNSGIDPVTGRPRGAPPPQAPAKAVATPPTQPPASGRAAGDELLLVPGRPDGSGTPPRARDANAGARQPGGASPVSPATERPMATTGGVRAGAPPVRPGYGSLGPKPNLNAGRPLDVPAGGQRGIQAGMQSGGRSGVQAGVQGGTPAPRPGLPRTGGGVSGRSTQNATPSRGSPPPRPGLFPQASPRVSAEDIGQ
jgi:hypothetical protein